MYLSIIMNERYLITFYVKAFVTSTFR
jgi:hypothetical protein